MVVLLHLRNLSRLSRGEVPPVARWPLNVTIGLLLALVSLGALWMFASH